MITDELTKLRKDVDGIKKKKKEETQSEPRMRDTKKKIKTVNNPELVDVVLPYAIKKNLATYNITYLWNGGIFTLDKETKKQMKMDSEGDPKVYLKAKMTVFTLFLYFFYFFFS